MPALTGGCLCGAIHYAILGGSDAIFDAGYCHCSICRRAHGAPVLAWANVSREKFVVTAGSPQRFRSSEKGCRLFCPDCGTPIAFEPNDPDGLVSFSIATLSDPTAVAPRVHMCVADKLPWFEIADELPRFPGSTLPHPDKRG
jgi:hypothetical protein